MLRVGCLWLFCCCGHGVQRSAAATAIVDSVRPREFGCRRFVDRDAGRGQRLRGGRMCVATLRYYRVAPEKKNIEKRDQIIVLLPAVSSCREKATADSGCLAFAALSPPRMPFPEPDRRCLLFNTRSCFTDIYTSHIMWLAAATQLSSRRHTDAQVWRYCTVGLDVRILW